ncbi:MAG: hypothetical protein JNL23_12700 [Chitinophagaceae bacterium]|nr:hypothetical protein [Chitinophagaceae bacterium]
MTFSISTFSYPICIKYFFTFAKVRKPVAIFFLFLFLGTTTEFGQLLKFPKFIIHYLKHRDEAPGLGIKTFVNMHYNKWDVKDEDYAEDMQLPFKTQDAFTTGITISPVVVPFADFDTPKIEYTTITSYTLVDDDLLPCSYTGSIFQPPRA